MIDRLLAKIGGGDIGTAALKAIFLSGLLSIFLKIFGLIKEAVLANYFGVSGQLDIYILAMLVLLFFVNPVAGTIGTLLTQKYIETKQVSKTLASYIYRRSLLVSGLLILLILIIQFAAYQIPWFHNVFFNRFDDTGIKALLILAPVAVFSTISVINGAILTADKRFLLFSSLPVIVPLSIIVYLAFNIAGDLFYSLLIGTIFGFVLEMAGGTIVLRRLWSKLNENVADVAQRKFTEMKSGFFPLFSASLLMGGCIVVDQFMASIAGEGAVSIVNFGSKLAYGLISVVGIAWIVLYPTFSELANKREYQELRKIYLRFIGLCVIGILPFCLAVSFFSRDLIALFFQRGAFSATDTEIVSQLQIFYLLHIPFYTICILSIRLANSFQDQKIVLIGNSFSLALNIVMNLIFIKLFGVVGIAAATLLSYIAMSGLWILITFVKFFRFSFLQVQPSGQMDGKNRIGGLPFKNTDVDSPLAVQNFIHFIKYKVNLSRLWQFLFTRAVIYIRNAKESKWAKQDAKNISPSDDVLFVDLGSNLGQGYTWFRKYYNHKNIMFELFEPNPYCCEKLKQLPEIASGEVKLIEAAASYYSGTTSFYGIAPDEGDIYSVGGSIIKGHRRTPSEISSQNSLDVQVIDFCDYLEQKHKIHNKIIVKMDIEGAEILLLEKLISAGTIKMISILYVEFHSQFLEGENAKKTFNREQKIINLLSKIPNFKLRIWH